MKKFISFFTVALFLCFSINSFAQVSSKFFTQFSGTYTEITGGTLVAAATATTGAGGLDDVNFSAQPIPFTFNYNGTNYTDYNINTNGYITFGATLPAAGSPYTPISNPAAYDGAISGAGRDLWGLFRTSGTRTSGSPVLTSVANFDGVAVGQFITGTGIPGTTTVPTTTIVSFDQGAGTITMSANATSTGASTTITMNSGDIRSETTGSVGSRVHTIQYRDFARFAGTNENLNFQIRLYETSNVIEVVYGSNTTTNTSNATPQVGLRGLTNTDYSNRTGTVWSASTAGAINTATMSLLNTSLPASGQTYNWDVPPACVIVISNLNPTGTIFPGCGTTYAPKVNILNNGTDAQTNISVNYAVGIYNETVSGLSLAAGANMDVDFPNTLSYTTFDAGVKNVTVTVDATCNGPVQYVLNTDFTVSPLNPNFGGPVDNYYFANSTPGASCAPDQPFVEWEDTTGSTSLILDGANQVGALLFGSVDDGFFALGDPIDGVQRYFRYQGVDYDSFFVGTNGMIAFSRANNTQSQLTTFTPLAIPGTSAPRPAIFPFWKDFNYTDVDVPVNRLSYKATADKLIITYDRAPNFNTAADPDDYASFQVVLEISTAPTLDGWIQVNYNEPGTGASFLAKYFGLTLTAHTVGQQNVAGTSAIQYRRAVASTVTNSGPLYSSSVSVAYGPDQNALPVELASFTASTNGNNVDLNWSTTTETNNSGFDIERSNVNGSWTKIGNVTGNGTTASAQNYTYRDRNVTSGNYNYRLKQIDFNGNFAYYNLSNEVNVGIPTQYALSQNYPNPFNPSTSINYEIPFDGKVSLKIFDMTGKEVMTLVNEVKTAGYYTYNFNASNLSSGVYFYSISANNFTATKKMMLLK